MFLIRNQPLQVADQTTNEKDARITELECTVS